MKKTLPICLLVFLCGWLLAGHQAWASHFVGSDFNYKAVPGQPNRYVLTVNFYRDCGGIPAPTNVPVTCLPITCSLPAQTKILPLISFSEVSEVCPGLPTECSTPPGPTQGIQRYIYSDTVQLPGACPGWRFSFQDCCRNAGITNLNNSSQLGFFVDAHLNNTNGIVNNSPTYTASPAPYFCVNDTVTYTPQVSDIDGDSLAFFFDIPFDEPFSGNYMPTPIPFLGAFSPNQPFGTWVTTTLDPATGMIEFIPTMAGAFVMVLRVEEWRTINGTPVRVGVTRRDIQVQVMPCTTPCPLAGNVIGVNGNPQSGSQMVMTLANQPLEVNIPATSTNPNVTLTMTSNNAIEIPGSTFAVTGSGSSVVGVFNWTPDASKVSTTPHFFSFRVQDNACPIPNERYGVIKVLVSENPNGTAPQVSSLPILLPNLLTAGQPFVVPAGLGQADLQVFDTAGRLVFRQQNYTNTWSGGAAPAGMYLFQLRLHDTGQIFGGKLVLQR